MSRFLLIKKVMDSTGFIIQFRFKHFVMQSAVLLFILFLPICFRNVDKLTPFIQAIVVDVPIMIKSCYHSFLENIMWFTSIFFMVYP